MTSCIRGTGGYYKLVRDKYNMRQTPKQRLREIKNYIKSNRECKIADICDYVGWSRYIVQKDINRLKADGVVYTVKGNKGKVVYNESNG